jgi:ectoine hydroxylase-related dioxygenase (phytanoyl-CoA dioxygenase family)
MVDDFRPENGATRFVPGSHRWLHAPQAHVAELRGNHAEQVQACGPAGSLIIFNGSTWHDHAANTSDLPRRSLQGAFIPRDGKAAQDFAARLHAETRARISPLAQYVLAI